jgi:DNA-directed RNA polymerase specialized sigma24 family protein
MPVMASIDSAKEPRRGRLDSQAMMPSELDWSAFYAGLHSFVAARVRNASDVDDLVQLILERAMSKSARCRNPQRSGLALRHRAQRRRRSR